MVVRKNAAQILQNQYEILFLSRQRSCLGTPASDSYCAIRTDVVMQGNLVVYKALRNQMAEDL